MSVEPAWLLPRPAQPADEPIVPEAVPASGYHDPVTARLVAATSLARKAREIPDECFAR